MSKNRVVGAIVCLLVLAAPTAFAENAPAPSDGDLIPVKRVAPQFPQAALVKGISGVVHVAGTVAPDGSVVEVHVVSSNPAGMFDAATLRAVKQWTFKPRIVDGVAVEREFEQRIQYNLSGPGETDPLLELVGQRPDEARALYRGLRALCPDRYHRADDAANAALATVMTKGERPDDMPATPLFVPRQTEQNASHLRRVSECLFTSWEQLKDPEMYSLAGHIQVFGVSREQAKDNAAAFDAVAVQKRGVAGAVPPTPAQLLNVRAWVFKRMSPAYYALISAQAGQFPPAKATGEAALSALDRANAALGQGKYKEARSVLVKALKSTPPSVDRGLLLSSLARIQAALNDIDDALASLAEASAIEQLPWNLALTVEMARASLCGRTRDAACFDASLTKLNAELGVTDKLKF